MVPICKSLILLVLPACCLVIYSCTGQERNERKGITSVACSDTSKHLYALDTIKGYKLKPNVPLLLLLNIESFNNKEEFNKYFVRLPVVEGSVPPALNFKDNWYVGILIDNKTQNITREWVSVNTQLWIDSAFTENCRLVIPFYLVAQNAPGYELTTERRSLLYRIPRTGQFNKVYIQNKGGTLSRWFEIPAAGE